MSNKNQAAASQQIERSRSPQLTAAQERQIDALFDLAIAEDIGSGDITTMVLTGGDARLSAVYRARETGVLSGGEIVERFFERLDSRIKIERLFPDGALIKAGDDLIRISGAARSILAGERVSLNLLQRMSGIATITHHYVEKISGTAAKIYDTRKTLPGHRALDKIAVVNGGGENHRLGLFDMILIKDNHLTLAGIASPFMAVKLAREKSKLPIMVEVDTLVQLQNVLPSAPDYILLDNMPPEILRQAVQITAAAFPDNYCRPKLEASGGITIEKVRAIAKSGVERISIGALTHSVRALDIGLDSE